MTTHPFRPTWGTIVLAVLACGIAGYAIATYLTGNPLAAGFLQGKAAYQDFRATPGWTWALVLHAGGGSLALLIGAAQWLRLKALRRLHRWLGVAYLASIVVAGVAGLVMAPVAMGGPVAVVGFFALDVLWLGSTARAAWLGLQMGRGGSSVETKDRHRAWMIRSYSLTAAAITLRLWLPVFLLGGVGFLTAYTIISWLCWVPNVVVAEVLVRQGKVPQGLGTLEVTGRR